MFFMDLFPLYVILYCRYFIENEEERPLYFNIGVNSGIIRTSQVLDREETAWHNITVMAAEVGKFTATANCCYMFIRSPRRARGCARAHIGGRIRL